MKDVIFVDGSIRLRDDAVAERFHCGCHATQNPSRRLKQRLSVNPNLKQAISLHTTFRTRRYLREVKVDEDLGTIEVSRVVTAVAAGRILNPKTARSQIMGGIVWGIGMALRRGERDGPKVRTLHQSQSRGVSRAG